MSQHEVMAHYKALFMLAGLDNPARFYELRNEYMRDGDPWALVIVTLGRGPCEIKIGWRKRVINIDWSATGLDLEVFFFDDVTKGPGFIHAWGYAKALEYLQLLGTLLRCTPEGLDRYRAHAVKQAEEKAQAKKI